MKFKKREKSNYDKFDKLKLKIYNSFLKNLFKKFFILNNISNNVNKCTIQYVNKFLILFLIFNLLLTITSAVCPTTFFAQTISQLNVSTLNFYLIKYILIFFI